MADPIISFADNKEHECHIFAQNGLNQFQICYDYKMTTKLILDNADKLGQVNIAEHTGIQIPHYGRNAQPCFFLWREVVLPLEYIKQNGMYRHCKVYKGRFLDYITRKEFATLEEWVADCGSSMDQIMFGFSKFDNKVTYMTLQQLIDHFDPLPPLIPLDPEVDELAAFANKLHIDELSLRNVLVVTREDGIKSYKAYMEIE